VGGAGVAHGCRHHGLPRLFGPEPIGARGFGRAQLPAPDVDLEGEQIEDDSPKRTVAAGPSGQGELTAAGVAKASRSGASRNLRELIRSCDPQIGARRLNSRHGLAQIVIVDDSRTHQVLKLYFLEDLE